MIRFKLSVLLIKIINKVLSKMGIVMSVNIHKMPERYLSGRGVSNSYKDLDGNDVIYHTQKDSIITYFY